MKLAKRCLPMGALPYENIETTTRMIAKLFADLPFLPLLPKISKEDTLINRTLSKIPGVRINDKNIEVKLSSNNYKNGIAQLETAFNNANLEDLEQFAIEAPFMEKYFQFIKKFQPENALINLIGPFTISQMLINTENEEILTDKNYRKLFILAVCVKALWVIKKIAEICPTTVPIVMLEENLLNEFSNIKHQNENITSDVVITLLARVIEKLKAHGAIVGVQCLDKCDWKIPINAGVDIISFDAYNNPNNIRIIPDVITDFIEQGGKINWCIVPTFSENIVKSQNIDQLKKRLLATMDGLISAGVSVPMVYNSALVSLQGDIDKLSVIFAEKVLMHLIQLAKRIPIIKQ